jgi:hypothetical protein
MRDKLTETLRSHTSRSFRHEALSSAELLSQRPVVLFLATILIYFSYLILTQPNWVLAGEMWAEMATNYYKNANAISLYQKLLSTDSGYIPAPQRLIAYVGNILNLPAASIPYFYTWAAAACSALLVGAFNLAPFRALIRSDISRFLVSLVILQMTDFETKTFINFTYYGAFFIACITALAATSDQEDVPWWAWVIPILMVSKPAVLAALPLMTLVCFISRPRFRWITIVSIMLCLAQLVQMVISQKSGTMAPHQQEPSIWLKLNASFQYFFGLLGGYIKGPHAHMTFFQSKRTGFYIFLACCLIFYKSTNKSKALIAAGLALLFFNVLLNSFALSDMWNTKLSQLIDLPVYRHIIVGYIGCIMVVAGILNVLVTWVQRHINTPAYWPITAALFAYWFVWSGWLQQGGLISKVPNSPITQNSQWQAMAPAIEFDQAPLCIPIDPLGWFYTRNCSVLLPKPNLDEGYTYHGNAITSVDIQPPEATPGTKLISLAIVARAMAIPRSRIEVRADIKLKGGEIARMYGNRTLTKMGGLIQLNSVNDILISDISNITLIFNIPVDTALMGHTNEGKKVVYWMIKNDRVNALD